MRLHLLVLASMLTAGPAWAQTPEPSAAGATPATRGDAARPSDLPVSLDHIREGLKRPESPLLKTGELPADFRIEIVEQKKIDELLKKLDFGSGPAPAGGLYAYEQQRRLFSPTDRPLMQPYAAYNGGEFITIALENLIAKYLGGRVLNSLSDWERARAERAAREEVDREIAAYCASRPDRADLELCTNTIAR
jgi:hypothetical protein